MKQRNGYFILLFFFFAAFNLSIKAQTDNNYSPDVKKRIGSVENSLRPWVKVRGSSDWTLEERLKYYHAKGISIAVIKDFKIDWAKGYGWADSSEQRPVTTNTLFQAGSISKSLNALGILKLAQNGKLDLFTDINRYLLTWKFPYDSLSNGKKISLANLLSHTAGLSIHGFPGYPIDDIIPSLTEILNGVPPANTKPVRSEFEPSLKFKYSGGGTTISQLIVEDMTQESYAAFMRKTILLPLGMKTSTYEQPPSSVKKDLLGTGYRTSGDEVIGKFHIYPEQAAAGLWTNPTELAGFILEIQQSLLGRSNKILSMEMSKRYVTPFVDSGAALGVFVTIIGNNKYFMHDGSDRGFTAKFIASLEKGYGAIIMTNTSNTELINEVINAIALTYNWKGFLQPDKSVVQVKKDILNSYIGKYLFEEQTVTIVQEGKVLFLLTGNAKMQLQFTSETDFFVFEERANMRFTKDSKGKINGFVYNEEKYETIAKKFE